MCIEGLPCCLPFYFTFKCVYGMFTHVEYIQTRDKGRETSETKILPPSKLLWNFLFSSSSIKKNKNDKGW